MLICLSETKTTTKNKVNFTEWYEFVEEGAGVADELVSAKAGMRCCLVLHTPNIKFEIYLGIICIVVGKNGKENMEDLKTVQLSTVIVTLLYSTLLDNLPVKGLILFDFLVFYS